MADYDSTTPLSPIPSDIPQSLPMTSPVYERYQERFIKISSEKQQTGALGYLRRIHSLITRSNYFRLKYATHVAVEHMSQGDLANNPFIEALARTGKLLNKMQDPREEGSPPRYPSSAKMETLLANARTCYMNIEITKKKVQELEIGESLVVPIHADMHGMMMVLTCTGLINGKKMYSIEQHNTGLGVNQYHYVKVDENGRRLYQTALRIVDVPQDNLFGKNASFFENVMGIDSTVKMIYENFIPSAGGRIEDPSANEKHWSPMQLGGSCTASCLRSVMRSHLPPEENTLFEEVAKYELLLKTYKHIISGSGNSTSQKIVALEMVKEILHAHEKRGLAMSPELVTIQKRLEAMLPHKKITKKSRPFSSENMFDNLSFAFTTLRNGRFSKKAIEQAQPCLIKSFQSIMSHLKSNSKIPEQDMEKFMAVSDQIIAFYKDRPLTNEEIYFMTAISTILECMAESTKSKKETIKKQLSDITDFWKIMNQRFNALQLASRYENPLLKEIIDLAQSQIKHKEPEAPPEMKKMHRGRQPGS